MLIIKCSLVFVLGFFYVLIYFGYCSLLDNFYFNIFKFLILLKLLSVSERAKNLTTVVRVFQTLIFSTNLKYYLHHAIEPV